MILTVLQGLGEINTGNISMTPFKGASAQCPLTLIFRVNELFHHISTGLLMEEVMGPHQLVLELQRGGSGSGGAEEADP